MSAFDVVAHATETIVSVAAVGGAAGWTLKRLWGAAVLSVHAFETIQRELAPNGGESTYDLVRKVKAQGDQHEARLTDVEALTRSAAGAAAQAAEEARLAVTAANIAVAEARASRHAATTPDPVDAPSPETTTTGGTA